MDKTIEENRQGRTLVLDQNPAGSKKLFIESYGCQMNFSDSEIVASILANQGYNTTTNLEDADLVFGKHLFHQGQGRTNRSQTPGALQLGQANQSGNESGRFGLYG